MDKVFEVRGDYITLDAFLKAPGAADSGAHAKERVLAGDVKVDGEVELRRGRKLRGGETVEVDAERWTVKPAG